MEIRARIAAGNRCFYSLKQIFKSRTMSRVAKIKTYKTILKPVVMFGSETWVISERDKFALNAWERKILRKVYGPIQERNTWRIRTNQELRELYRDPDIVGDIKRKRLEWIGHVLRMERGRTARRILEEKPEGRRKVGRQRLRWLDGVEEDLRLLRVKRWRQKAMNREEWAVVLKEAKVLRGP